MSQFKHRCWLPQGRMGQSVSILKVFLWLYCCVYRDEGESKHTFRPDLTLTHKDLPKSEGLVVVVVYWLPRSFHLTTFFFKDFIYLFQRKREREYMREHKQGERQREEQTPHSAMWGSIPGPWDHDLSQTQTLYQLRHAGAPHSHSFKSKSPGLPKLEH